jgi:hypothetical protein
MAATEATIGYGSIFGIGDAASPEVFTALAEVSNITPPSDTVDTIDATHMASPNRTREFIQGLIDPGECSFDLNFIPGNSADDAIQAWKAAGGRKNCRITFPNSVTWTFAALLTGYEPAVPVDDKMTATVTLKVTGSYVTAGP